MNVAVLSILTNIISGFWRHWFREIQCPTQHQYSGCEAYFRPICSLFSTGNRQASRIHADEIILGSEISSLLIIISLHEIIAIIRNRSNLNLQRHGKMKVTRFLRRATFQRPFVGLK